MKTNELMIGDWVFNAHHGENIQITPYDFFTHGHFEDGKYIPTGVTPSNGWDLDPIPITPEILEKNGFTYCKSDGGFYLHTTMSYGDWEVEVVLFNATDEYRNNQLHISSPDDSYIAIHLMECNHVHELQHALRLCGIKKEIKI